MSTIKRRARNQLPVVDPGVWELLNDLPPPPEANPFLIISFDGEESRARWAAFGEQVLAEWVLEHPGTRPSCWWLYDAPVGDFSDVCAGEPSSVLKSRSIHYGRARIPPKDQRAYLAKHKLLRPGE